MDPEDLALIDEIDARYSHDHDFQSENIEILQDGYKQADDDRADLIAIARDAIGKLAEAETERDAAEARISDLEVELSDAQDDRRDAEDVAASLEAELAQLQQRNDELEAAQ